MWNNEKYCAKILHFNKDQSCSFHYHKIKDELFYCLYGKVKIAYGFSENETEAEFCILNQGEVFKIPVGLKHRVTAIEESELFEVSTQHFEEDSYRI